MNKVNKKVLLASSAIMVVLSPNVVQQADAATQAISAVATIQQAVALSQATALDFGQLTQTAAGTVNIDFNNSVTTVAGGLNSIGGGPTSGGLQIKAALTNVVISSTAATYMLSANGGGTANKTLKVNDIQYQLLGATGPTITPLLTAGTDTAKISANLVATAGQSTGVYTGSIKANVVYQ